MSSLEHWIYFWRMVLWASLAVIAASCGVSDIGSGTPDAMDGYGVGEADSGPPDVMDGYGVGEADSSTPDVMDGGNADNDSSDATGGPPLFSPLFDTGYEANEAVGCDSIRCGESSLAYSKLLFYIPQANTDWESWDTGDLKGIMDVYYEVDAPPISRSARIVDDPTEVGNRVLRLQVRDATIDADYQGHFKGRVQTVAHLNQPVPELYYRERVYLHPDFSLLMSYPADGDQWWLGVGLQEMRAGTPPAGDPYSFLMNVTLVPDFTANVFRMAIQGKKKALGDSHWTVVWYATDREAILPLGEWLTIETAYKQGDAYTGRFVVVVWREGGSEPIIVLNRTTWTYNPDSPVPVALNAWNGPQKLYSSDNVIHYIRDQGGVAQIYFDDFSLDTVWPAGWVPPPSTPGVVTE